MRDNMKTKLHKVLLSALVSTTSVTCFAEPGNFLIGATGGYFARNSNVSANVTYFNPAQAFIGIPPTNVIEDYDDNGLQWGLLVGYQARCDTWVLGGELSVDWEHSNRIHPFAFSDIEAINDGLGLGWNGTFRYQREYALGFSLRMGYILESLRYFLPPVFMPYVRAGIELSKDSLDVTYSGSTPFYPFKTASHFDKWPYRFVAGIGCEIPVFETNASLRFEYNYHSSGQSLETQSSINDNGIVNPTFVTAMNPVIQSAKIGLIWNFY